jgi:hypothetical protein
MPAAVGMIRAAVNNRLGNEVFPSLETNPYRRRRCRCGPVLPTAMIAPLRGRHDPTNPLRLRRSKRIKNARRDVAGRLAARRPRSEPSSARKPQLSYFAICDSSAFAASRSRAYFAGAFARISL